MQFALLSTVVGIDGFLMRYSWSMPPCVCLLTVCLSHMCVLWLNGVRGPSLLLIT